MYKLIKIIFFPIVFLIRKKRELERYRKQLDFLKSIVAARSLKPATGELRKVQLSNLKLANDIVAKLNNKNIETFMFFGTLLGAERHGGYIPWDDDLDFGVMREDYNRLIEYAKKEEIFYVLQHNRKKYIKRKLEQFTQLLKQYPNKTIFILFGNGVLKAIKGTSLADYAECDFLPFDYYSDNYSYNQFMSYIDYIKREKYKINNIPKEIEFMTKEIDNNENIVKNSNWIFYGIDNIAVEIGYARKAKAFFNKNDFYPLKTMSFENMEFKAPQNHKVLLEMIYGKDWESLPENILPSHQAWNGRNME